MYYAHSICIVERYIFVLKRVYVYVLCTQYMYSGALYIRIETCVRKCIRTGIRSMHSVNVLVTGAYSTKRGLCNK
jgi:hypothetical protein